MRHIERPNAPLLRLISIALLAAGLLAIQPSEAMAEPSTPERRAVAQEVAVSVCGNVPAIPQLPATINPKTICESVIVENVDPEGTNRGMRSACLAALPALAKLAAESCAKTLDQMLDPARRLFLDKVVPVAQQLACITSTPAAFDCLAQQIHVWLKQSILSLWQGLLSVLTADTKAITMLEGWRNQGIVSLYSDLGGLGATLLLGLMLVSLIISAIRFDFRQFGHTLLGVVVWGLFWSGGAVAALLLLKVSDDAARWVAGRPDRNGQTDLTRAGQEFGSWVDYVSGVSGAMPGGTHPVYNAGSFTAIVVCLLLIVAIVITLVALLMRNVAVLLLIVLLPLTLAGTAGPRMTREWFVSALRMFIALLLAKPLIVVALRLGAVLVSVPKQGERQASFSDAMLGVVIILLAGLLPGIIYRFSGGLLQTSGWNAPRAGGGLIDQSAQSTQSSIEMTRMIMERNAPSPAFASSGGGQASAMGAAARTAGPARGIGTAAGPIGLVALGATMAGEAIESGGRWAAGQAATAGGVLGDVDSPKVPSPPISRMGHYGPHRPLTDAGRAGHIPDRGRQPATTVTVVQTQPFRTPAPPLPTGGIPLIIPGTSVPDRTPTAISGPRALPSPSLPPRALPRGGEAPTKKDDTA